MSSWSSSSLATSDGAIRHKSKLLTNTKERLSKQHIMGNRMFGSRKGMHGKDFMIGKKFKKVGKGVMHGSTSGESHKGIGPSAEEFDDMMMNSSEGMKTSKNKKKNGFTRKMFG